MKRLVYAAFSFIVCFCGVLCIAAPPHDYRGGTHPGPRAGCPLCAQLDAYIKANPRGVVIAEPGGYSSLRSELREYHPTARPLIITSPAKGELAAKLPDLSTRPSTVYIYASVPKSAEQAAKIHGAAAEKVQSEYWEATRMAYKKLEQTEGVKVVFVDVAATEKGVASELTRQLSALKETDYAFVIGEVRSGRMHFHDGSSVPVGDLSARGGVGVLGCRTQEAIAKHEADVVSARVIARQQEQLGRDLTAEELVKLKGLLDKESQSGGTAKSRLRLGTGGPLNYQEPPRGVKAFLRGLGKDGTKEDGFRELQEELGVEVSCRDGQVIIGLREDMESA